MPYLRRVKMHVSTATSPAAMTSCLRSAGIAASVGLARSNTHPGNLDFAVTTTSMRDMEKAKDYLENLGWLVGDLETV